MIFKRFPAINAYYAFAVVIISCGSIPKGYDEGGFAGAASLPSFLADYHLLSTQWRSSPHDLVSRKADITSLGVLGAGIGALASLAMTDRLGRLRTWRVFAALWMTGNMVTVFASGRRVLLLVSRVWSGLGAGALTVVAPLYLAEVAPARSRGMVVSVYMVVLLLFLMIGFFISFGAGKSLPPSREQYRIVLGVPLIPVGIAFLSSFFLRDTPRWLASQGRRDEALDALARLRKSSPGDAHVEREFAEINDDIRDKEQILADVSTWDIIKEIATVASYRKRFLLGVMMQTVAQWSGGNGITYYIPQIFRFAGVRSDNVSLVTSGAYGAVKLFFTMVFTWALIDVFGRRRCFLAGLSLQCVTHVYMALYTGLWMDARSRAASDAAIASVFVYAVGWSIGLCTVQYLYGTEILPTRVRGVSYAATMTIHWFFQFAVVRAAPPMFESLHVWGAYVFWAAVCAGGLVVLGLWAPETKGVPMENMADLFSGPWYLCWKARLRTLEDSEMSKEKGLGLQETGQTDAILGGSKDTGIARHVHEKVSS